MEDFFMKTKICVYDNDTLVISGTSYYLFVMDYYKVLQGSQKDYIDKPQEFSADVQKLWDENNPTLVRTMRKKGNAEEDQSEDASTTSTECFDRDNEKVDQI